MALLFSSVFPQQWQQVQRMVIYGTVFLIMTLLILYSSNSSADLYSPFKVNEFHYAIKHTNLKKWAGKEAYVPVYGNKSMSLHCRQCALVTSSSHVLGTHAGDEIDRTECVIRMNDAPTSTTPSNTPTSRNGPGRRHTFLFTKMISCKPSKYTHTHTYIYIYIYMLYRLIQRVSMTYSNLSFFFISPGKMQRFDTLFQKETGRDRKKSQSWLSTGWFTMVIAIEMCDNIKVYGMVPPNHCGKRPQGPDECVMYLQNERGRRGSHHRSITEKQVFACWAKQYNISCSHPTW
uniref:Alpha-N-acetylgalactosaminide alpha-2,6-sialyltransferase 6-like n=1 Tax=Sinocyclocheilus anshuiensis TaxID=1608454 RepID=A0A671QLH7_9TELE